MLFNSHAYLFLFLPGVLIGFFLLGRLRDLRIAKTFLLIASIVFYGLWSIEYVPILLYVLVSTYAVGIFLTRRGGSPARKRGLVAFGTVNALVVLGFFKYANFFLENVNALTGSSFSSLSILLPIGISFYTFQQIAYLVECYRGEEQRYGFIDFALSVTFFPKLFAGPIALHREIIPQWRRRETYRPQSDTISAGLTLIIIGLVKKVLIADMLGGIVDPVLLIIGTGSAVYGSIAWGAIFAFTFQLYFDFSAYSDMAIGSALLFGIRLPVNFWSPYRATSIIEFWRRWHITLSRFLRDYLYIPLGGNRKGVPRQFVNIMITMLLGGMWHGSGWTFIIWGGLHGVYLIVNHAWRKLRPRAARSTTGYQVWVARAGTFLVIALAWTFFRAESVRDALHLLGSAVGGTVNFHLIAYFKELVICAVLLLVVWFLPDSNSFLARLHPALHSDEYAKRFRDEGWLVRHLQWSPTAFWAFTMAILLAVSLIALSSIETFVYFQF